MSETEAHRRAARTGQRVTIPVAQHVKLRLQLHDAAYKPCASVRYRVELDPSGKVLEGTTNAQGWVEQEIEDSEDAARVTYRPPGAEDDLTLPVQLPRKTDDADRALLGHLANMGFAGSSDRARLLAFQAARGLSLTGSLDEATRAQVLALGTKEERTLEAELGGAAPGGGA